MAKDSINTTLRTDIHKGLSLIDRWVKDYSALDEGKKADKGRGIFDTLDLRKYEDETWLDPLTPWLIKYFIDHGVSLTAANLKYVPRSLKNAYLWIYDKTLCEKTYNLYQLKPVHLAVVSNQLKQYFRKKPCDLSVKEITVKDSISGEVRHLGCSLVAFAVMSSADDSLRFLREKLPPFRNSQPAGFTKNPAYPPPSEVMLGYLLRDQYPVLEGYATSLIRKSVTIHHLAALLVPVVMKNMTCSDADQPGVFAQEKMMSNALFNASIPVDLASLNILFSRLDKGYQESSFSIPLNNLNELSEKELHRSFALSMVRGDHTGSRWAACYDRIDVDSVLREYRSFDASQQKKMFPRLQKWIRKVDSAKNENFIDDLRRQISLIAIDEDEKGVSRSIKENCLRAVDENDGILNNPLCFPVLQAQIIDGNFSTVNQLRKLNPQTYSWQNLAKYFQWDLGYLYALSVLYNHHTNTELWSKEEINEVNLDELIRISAQFHERFQRKIHCHFKGFINSLQREQENVFSIIARHELDLKDQGKKKDNLVIKLDKKKVREARLLKLDTNSRKSVGEKTSSESSSGIEKAIQECDESIDRITEEKNILQKIIDRIEPSINKFIGVETQFKKSAEEKGATKFVSFSSWEDVLSQPKWLFRAWMRRTFLSREGYQPWMNQLESIKNNPKRWMMLEMIPLIVTAGNKQSFFFLKRVWRTLSPRYRMSKLFERLPSWVQENNTDLHGKIMNFLVDNSSEYWLYRRHHQKPHLYQRQLWLNTAFKVLLGLMVAGGLTYWLYNGIQFGFGAELYVMMVAGMWFGSRVLSSVLQWGASWFNKETAAVDQSVSPMRSAVVRIENKRVFDAPNKNAKRAEVSSVLVQKK